MTAKKVDIGVDLRLAINELTAKSRSAADHQGPFCRHYIMDQDLDVLFFDGDLEFNELIKIID